MPLSDRSTTFCATTPPAYATAAARQSRTPCVVVVWFELATAMIATPAKATAQPAKSARGNPSCRSRPARTAISTGPTLTSIAAVPASIRRSPAFSARLYAPNQSSPQSRSAGPPARRAARDGRRSPRSEPIAARATAATSRRPSESAPGPKARPAERMPTNAEAHSRTVTSAAASAAIRVRRSSSTVARAVTRDLTRGSAVLFGLLDERREQVVERGAEALDRMARTGKDGPFGRELPLEDVADE